MTDPTHDAVLLFSKTWGALYLLAIFIGAVVWAYWPSKKTKFDAAARWPVDENSKEDRPCR